MLERENLRKTVASALNRTAGVVLVGPRQVGKSTLARSFVTPDSPNYFDLENPRDQIRLEDPLTALSALQGLVVIDEVQLRPDLFPVLRVLIDKNITKGRVNGQFLLLGSASPSLLKQSSESLLGRVEVIEMTGFNIDELPTSMTTDSLWLRGGFPLSLLAKSEPNSVIWRRNALNQFLQVDLPQLGINIPAPAMLRFMKMAAHMHGQVWNSADPARSLGISETTVRRYLDYLTQTFTVRQLQPWFENISKRQVKSPKVYFRDSGFLNHLLSIDTVDDLLVNPRCGASWEGFALEQVLRLAQPDDAYFWATHADAELDLLLIKGSQRVGVEFKRSDAPKLTRSMRVALDDLKLDRLYVVYPGPIRYRLSGQIEVVPLNALLA
jgi:uncharacterized protein